MCKPINVLIVEDEPLIIEALTRALNIISENEGRYEFTIRSVTNSDLAIKEIENATTSKPFDLVFLDISIPPSQDKRFLSGEDIGVEIKSLFPKIKVIVFTSYNNNYRLNSILKSIDPDGFLIKTDIDHCLLLEAINAVIQEPPFYSKAIQQLIRKQVASDYVLDAIDRKLLYHLYKGGTAKDIAEVVNLSSRSVEKRKLNIKIKFGVEGGSDFDLLSKAELAGFI